MAAVTALRERARAAVFAAGGRGFVRFLPAGETALLVSDAPRRCGDVPALLDRMRARGFDETLVSAIAGENFAQYMKRL